MAAKAFKTGPGGPRKARAGPGRPAPAGSAIFTLSLFCGAAQRGAGGCFGGFWGGALKTRPHTADASLGRFAKGGEPRGPAAA